MSSATRWTTLLCVIILFVDIHFLKALGVLVVFAPLNEADLDLALAPFSLEHSFPFPFLLSANP